MVVIVSDLVGEVFHLVGIEMVDDGRDAGAAELGDEVGSLFDRLVTVVVGPQRLCPAAATCANDGRAGFAQSSGDATPGTARSSRNDGDAPAQCVSIRRP